MMSESLTSKYYLVFTLMFPGGEDSNGKILGETEIIQLPTGVSRFGGNLSEAKKSSSVVAFGGHYKRLMIIGLLHLFVSLNV